MFIGLKKVVVSILTSEVVYKLIRMSNPGTISYYGVKIDPGFSVVENYVKSLLYWGLYEKQEAKFIRKYLPNHLPVIELGSSIGAITSIAAKKIAPQKLVALEVNPDLIPVSKRNLALNSLDNWEVINAAIGRQGEAYFTPGVNNTVGTVEKMKSDRSTRVKSFSLSALVKLLDLKKFSLISDIEGSEVEFLFSGDSGLEKCDFMVIELHVREENGRVITIEDMVNRLIELGFFIVAHYGSVYVAKRND